MAADRAANHLGWSEVGWPWADPALQRADRLRCWSETNWVFSHYLGLLPTHTKILCTLIHKLSITLNKKSFLAFASNYHNEMCVKHEQLLDDNAMWCLMFMWSSWPWQMATTVMFCCVLRCAAVSPLVWSINLYHAAVFIIHSRRSVPHVLCCPWVKDTVSLCFSQPKEERIILEANESNSVSYAQSLTEHRWH